MKKTAISIMLLIVSFFYFPVQTFARMKIIPRFVVSEEYNDNIYLDRRDKEDDWITTINPGISFFMQSRNLDVDLDYSMHLRYYKDNSDKNQTDFREIHRASGSATLFPGHPFTINANANINTVVIDDSQRFSDENSFVNRALMYDFSINPNYNWRISSTFNAEMGYTYHYVTYQEFGSWDYANKNDEPNDWQEHVVNFGLNKQISHRTSCGIGYVFTDHNYKDNDEDEDFMRHDIFASLEQQIGSRLTLNLRGGMAFFDFDESGNYDGNIWEVGLDYIASKRLNMGIFYKRDYAVSVSRGISQSDEVVGTVNYQSRINVNIEGFARNSDYSEVNQGFADNNSEDKSIGGRLNINYPLGKRLSLNFDTDYAYWKFKPENEKVDRYGIGGSIAYNFYKNFNASFSYTYRVNDSDMDKNDYTNNIAFLSIGWRLNR